MNGKTVLITGTTGGIGLEAARELARRGARVVVGARDGARGQAVVTEIANAGGKADLLRVDLASFASIREAAARIKVAHPKLDVLVNNAGVVTKTRLVNADKHEVIWATNFLGPELLTRLLLPELLAAQRPRVVNVSSMAHTYGRINWDDLELQKGWRGLRAYANSKLALVLFTRELARREPRIAANAVHPGAIATGIWRAAPQPFWFFINLVLPSPKKGSRPLVHLAAAPELEGVSGRYFDRGREVAPAPAAGNDADAARLWELTTEALSS
jgi:retinol dehydrogenase-12